MTDTEDLAKRLEDMLDGIESISDERGDCLGFKLPLPDGYQRLEALGEEAAAALRSKDEELYRLKPRIKELEGALRPFANVPAIGKHGGRFVIAHAVYDDMKRPGDCAPRQCYWHLDQFDRARSTLNPETDHG